MRVIDVVFVVYGELGATMLAITHLLACTNAQLRFIVIDNASPDPRTAELLHGWLGPEHTVIRNAENVGCYRAMNQGLRLTTSDLVIYAASDFYVVPGWFEFCRTAVEDYGFLWATPLWRDGPYTPAILADALTPEVPQQILTGHYGAATSLIRWPVLRDRVGEFDERFFLTFGDTDHMERMRAAQVQFGVVTGVTCLHTGAWGSRQRTDPERLTDILLTDQAAFREKWADHPEVLERHPLLGPREDVLAHLKRRAAEAV